MHLDPDGFLAEPHAAQFYSVNLNLKTLEQLDLVGCLLLLGDPALGKSWDLGEYAERLSDRIRESSARREESNHDVLVAFDATEFDSTHDFRVRVFADDAISRWKRGRGILYLVIDSVDEARMDSERFSSALFDELESLPIDRLRLRLACRTAVVPPTLRQGLRLKFRSQETPRGAGTHNSDEAAAAGRGHGGEVTSSGQHSTSTPANGDAPVLAEISPAETTAPSEYYAEYELAILTRGQARALVVAELTSEEAADQFFAAISLVDAHVGATRPQTLRSMISRYDAGQSLEASQVELFRSLCLTLCTPCPVQPDAYHLDGPVLSQRERYRVASRIAEH